MTDIQIAGHASKAFWFALALVFLGACGGGGDVGGVLGGGNTSTNSVQQVGPGAGVSRSERFTVYGSVTPQAQRTSEGTIYQVTEPTTTLGSESIGK